MHFAVVALWDTAELVERGEDEEKGRERYDFNTVAAVQWRQNLS